MLEGGDEVHGSVPEEGMRGEEGEDAGGREASVGELERMMRNLEEEAPREMLGRGMIRDMEADMFTEQQKLVSAERDLRIQQNYVVTLRGKMKAGIDKYETQMRAKVDEVAEVKASLAAAMTVIAADVAKEQARARRETRLTVERASTAIMMQANIESAKAEERIAINLQDEIEGRLHVVESDAAQAVEAADEARQEAIEEANEAAAEAERAKEESEELKISTAKDIDLLSRQLKRAHRKAKALEERVVLAPGDRTLEEWAALSREARAKAVTRERTYLANFMASHEWRCDDLAFVLSQAGLLEGIFLSKEMQDLHVKAVDLVLRRMETEGLGISFALFLHFDLKLTLSKISSIVNAGGKSYKVLIDRYERKIALYHPHRKNVKVLFPRLLPPRNRIEAKIKEIYADLGIVPSEDGSVAIKPVLAAVSEMISEDCGKQGMPTLDCYRGGAIGLNLVFSADATGFGTCQFNTYGLNNPYTSKSARNLRIIGLGNCDDGREGCRKVLGDNLKAINELILADEENRCVDIQLDEGIVSIQPNVFMVDDVSKIRHGEHLAASGWCGCSRNLALRQTPKHPPAGCSLSQFKVWLGQCISHSRIDRYTLGHNTVPGEAVPRPCFASGCKFGHGTNEATLAAQHDLLEEEAKLKAVDTVAGKAKFSKWRMEFAARHGNVQPGLFGRPFLIHNFDRQILDPLHLAELGDPKTPWKHVCLVNASDDARDQISVQLKEWHHPLDCRRKDNNRVRTQKWFTGERWATFCSGHRGSPGGPAAIAKIVHIIATDLLLRGVDSGSAEAGPEATSKKKPGAVARTPPTWRTSAERRRPPPV